jgi:hypothetical protein
MKADNVKPIPIIHYTEAKAPIITCVALDRTEGKVLAPRHVCQSPEDLALTRFICLLVSRNNTV